MDACGFLDFFSFQSPMLIRMNYSIWKFSKRWRKVPPLLASNGACFLDLLGSSGTQAWSKCDTRSLPVSSFSLLCLVPMACKNKVRVLWPRHVASLISLNARSDPTEYPHCPSWANWDLCPRPQNQYPNQSLFTSQGHVSSATKYKPPKA